MMISAAPVMIRAVEATLNATASVVDAPCAYRSRMRLRRNTV